MGLIVVQGFSKVSYIGVKQREAGFERPIPTYYLRKDRRRVVFTTDGSQMKRYNLDRYLNLHSD